MRMVEATLSSANIRSCRSFLESLWMASMRSGRLGYDEIHIAIMCDVKQPFHESCVNLQRDMLRFNIPGVSLPIGRGQQAAVARRRCVATKGCCDTRIFKQERQR